MDTIHKYRVYAVSTKRRTERFLGYMWAAPGIEYARAKYRYKLKRGEKIIVREVKR